ncbi:MAG TPA: hypothetical protein VGY56_20630 [Verrucomicrobiae bacterium]|nr:hypothetical protein [Verrucomicrobiae bacterium]
MNKNTTLFGKKDVKVLFEDGHEETLSVRQFVVREYHTLLPLVSDEIALCAHACDRPRAAIESLAPASYQAVFDAMKEANAEGFFTYATRQIEANLKLLPPAMLEKLIGLPNSSMSSANLRRSVN